MTKIEQLKAQVKAIAEANAAKIQEAAEVARLEATIKLESSPELMQAKVRLMSSQQQTEKLQQLVNECEQIVASVPVFNSKTRQNRVWAGGHRYGFGTQVDLMYQLATGILYACQEHKQLLVAHTGLNTELLEQIVTAFGTPTYYNRNYHTIVEPKTYDLETLKSALAVMQSDLGVVVDISQITNTHLEAEFARAEVTAQNNFELAKEAIAEADFKL
ncbi:hypothetical protein AD45P2_00200 [Alteromonas phage vB_AmaP_AD45-P2]|uniref:Uncharacterized protein n=1 Tax=Pseudorhizobium pelagicum TaxID=1509405 RepID=A0A922P0D6_9HYPH|nr:hypothetical protein [Pseudorhizobium pelagicum]YP_008126012.1 hypothetical protein M610_gp041 [Alteromonas phage vB_AmaP_AD45-P1]AGM46979.1 hypothetical protein AD45P3_00205 [Alteromonas phage vB_AmaP_AD45-P3]AGM47096.1 hypothetical protein AD45P4_00205 [Alteromonas phage vB_AmaP_AD45-P4]AGM47211.1 hypothetical protein AD45P2_00200 [Alteromonas phage vB_AmaP_AD45-P2]AGM46859.1 hypothetical protein AD45P1_00205 [Alteromonas phage vB_AmaP_AD45-P1]KEQ05551.1 hypothetical protein GV68_08455 [